jgi:hypothetical protein
MRFRLRTLLLIVALAPPLVALLVVGLERSYARLWRQWQRRAMEQERIDLQKGRGS